MVLSAGPAQRAPKLSESLHVQEPLLLQVEKESASKKSTQLVRSERKSTSTTRNTRDFARNGASRL